MPSETVLVANQCRAFRVETKDKVQLRVFSMFYPHPGMVEEEGWKIFQMDKDKILVDENTLYVLERNINEFGFEPKSDTIISCKLTKEGSQEEIDAHWDDMKKYGEELKTDYSNFKKADPTTALSELSLIDDSDHKESAPVEKEQTPPTKSE
jgi:hypothetical protein